MILKTKNVIENRDRGRVLTDIYISLIDKM